MPKCDHIQQFLDDIEEKRRKALSPFADQSFHPNGGKALQFLDSSHWARINALIDRPGCGVVVPIVEGNRFHGVGTLGDTPDDCHFPENRK